MQRKKRKELGRPFSAFQAIFKRNEKFLQNFRENAAFWRFLLFSGRDLSTDDSLEHVSIDQHLQFQKHKQLNIMKISENCNGKSVVEARIRRAYVDFL